MKRTYFCLDKNNFHKVANSGKGFLNRLNDAVEQSEYDQSDFYKQISKKLYEDGKIQIEYLKELIEEQTEFWIKPEEEIREIQLHSLNREMEHKFITKYEYNLKLNNIDETVKKQIKWRNELIDKLKHKLEVTQYVFGNSFEHFMNVTKQYGHVISGVRVIESHIMGIDVVAHDLGVYSSRFKVNV